jgi:hypothetical protein
MNGNFGASSGDAIFVAYDIYLCKNLLLFLFLQKFFNFIAEMAIDQACPDQ